MIVPFTCMPVGIARWLFTCMPLGIARKDAVECGWVSLDIPAHVVLACMPSGIANKVVLGDVAAKNPDWVPFGIPTSGGGFCECVMGGHVVDEMSGTVGWRGK